MKMLEGQYDEQKQLKILSCLNQDEQMIAETIRQFIKDKISPNMHKIEAHDYDLMEELFKQAGELGLLGAEVPEDYGGLEMGKRMSGIIAENMGYAASFSVAFNIHSGVGTLPYVYFGKPNQKERYLPRLLSGEWIGAYALTEPNAGSDALSPQTNAKWDDEKQRWVLNGEKQWITNAHIANIYVVFAKTNQGITAFIVERSMPGVSIGMEEKKLGIKGSSTATLILEDVMLEERHVLGEIGKGHYIALNILNLARLKLAFSNIGMSKQALEIAVKYGKERHQFGREIVQFGLIQEKLANMAIAIFKATCSAYYTAGLIDEQLEQSQGQNIMSILSDFSIDCSINKVLASEILDMVVDEALQIHGGYGYMQEYEIERMYRDARINRLFEGTNEINRLTITKSFMKQYREEEFSKTLERETNDHIRTAFKFISLIMKAISTSGQKQLDQMHMGMIADVLMEVYTIKATQLNVSINPIYHQMYDVLVEENLYRVKEYTERLLIALVTDSVEQQHLIDQMNKLQLPAYSNLFEKKANIAQAVIRNGGNYSNLVS